MKTLGIDIGGSALKGAIVDTTTGKLLSERFRIDTPDTLTPKEMAADIGVPFHPGAAKFYKEAGLLK